MGKQGRSGDREWAMRESRPGSHLGRRNSRNEPVGSNKGSEFRFADSPNCYLAPAPSEQGRIGRADGRDRGPDRRTTETRGTIMNLDNRMTRAERAIGTKQTCPTMVTIYAEEGEAIEDEWRGGNWCCILRVPPGTSR